MDLDPGTGTSSPKLKEECGICGVYGVEDATVLTYYGLHALQHRGQESAGIVVSDRENVRSRKGMGLVSDVISEKDFADYTVSRKT